MKSVAEQVQLLWRQRDWHDALANIALSAAFCRYFGRLLDLALRLARLLGAARRGR
jgi:hypothetical protein